MKKSILFLVLLQSLLIFAQAPQKMSYQSVVRNATNQIVANQSIGVKISIVEGSLTGTTVYAETHTTTTNANGLFTLEAGGGTPTTGTFSTINWGNGSHYIKSEIDLTGGTNYTLSGTMELMSVPYALFSEKSGNGVPNGNATGDVLSWNGTQWEAIANTATATNQNIPKVTTGSVNANYCDSSTIISDEGYSITAKGVCWSLAPNPTLADAFSSDGQGIGSFVSYYHDLVQGQLYYVRAYATNARGTGYGMTYTFTSATTSLLTSTTAISAITNNNAVSGGTLTIANNETISNRGIIWSTSPNPTIYSNLGVTSNGNGSGTFVSTLTNLITNTLYYVRAFGTTNSNVTIYGNQVSFTTGSLPYITTTAASAITTSSAQSGGTVNNPNPSENPILAKGVVWSTSQNPTVALTTKTVDGSTEGNFTSNITGLTLGITYFVRAYATTSLGTIYGNTINIRPGSLPTITTKGITTITNNSASCRGESLSNGGSVILEKGVVWSTSPNPTIDLATKTSDGAGNSSFNSTISNLSYSTTYYVRAYARNDFGTAYGNELVFATRTVESNDFYLGGKVVYILQPADPGYVAGEIHGYMRSNISLDTNTTTPKIWGCKDVFMGTTSADFGAGESNTIEIVNHCSGDTAAKYCYDLVDIGYDDWFLPSINEILRFPSSSYSWSAISSTEASQDTYYYSWPNSNYSGPYSRSNSKTENRYYENYYWNFLPIVPVRKF